MSTCKGAWKLQEVRDQVLAGEWITYDLSSDPGTLWVWGGNDDGQLGDGTAISKSSPIQIPGTSWRCISDMCTNSIARKSDGTLWTWGSNNRGQLGDNATAKQSSPIQVPGTSWNAIDSNYSRSLATKTDGTLWSWGVMTVVNKVMVQLLIEVHRFKYQVQAGVILVVAVIILLQ